MMDSGDFWKFLIVVVLFGMGLGWIVFDGIPMLWKFVKPYIHMVTA